MEHQLVALIALALRRVDVDAQLRGREQQRALGWVAAANPASILALQASVVARTAVRNSGQNT